MSKSVTPPPDGGTPSADHDSRFTVGLIYDVFQVLERHGYQRPVDENDRNRATGRSAAALLRLVRAFEGITEDGAL
ncbi:hypothetical protein [Thermomonospora cellulosilytica]|uniref:Uncharacterized protein n=1 Tax=Thermomonospora cellulosilytica TaxID=1411118 RepID=A0A7W3MU69_9ACTN|nr:hypothetical protein [Thermomonospora cellulosilytica]MBA9001988.1 hypothetical protein [Thermomonospora cellulosilytica]